MKGKKTGGRVKGSINEATKQLKTVKEVVLNTFLNREDNPNTSLAKFAEEYPKEFYSIAAKLIPTEISANVEMTKKELPPFMKANESQS
jgi:hypothetical protein